MLTAEEYLKLIKQRGTAGKPIKRVYLNMLRHKELFLSAYGKLYKNRGATTPGLDGETVDGMSQAKIDKLMQELKDRSFRWTPVKRVYIPKANGQQRPLGIPTWKDKMVQEVIRTILENYYEPQFSPHSHGFRPRRGCHTALAEIQKWTGTKWFIEGDIKGCYDHIDHQLLMKILERKIQDPSLLKLIEQLLKAGYMEDWTYHKTYSGTPQGGILSPLLANIYLNELDQFVTNHLLATYNREKCRKPYQPRKILANKLRAITDAKERQALRKQFVNMPFGDPNDPDFRRIRYVRYADDFILGFSGPKAEAKEITEMLRNFLKDDLNLELSQEKTVITHAKTEKAHFLGYHIHTLHCPTRRSINGRIGLRVPREVKVKWIAQYSKNGKPISRGSRINLTVPEIVRTYETELRGLYEYYKYAYNVSREISDVKYVMKVSLVKTIAEKLKIRASQVYRRYGTKNPSGIRVTLDNGKTVDFGQFPVVRRRKFEVQMMDDVAVYFAGRNELIERLENDICEIPGCENTAVQGHHIRALKDLKRKYGKGKQVPLWVEAMISRKRKSLMVCAHHHQEIHGGKYDGPKLNTLANWRAG